MPYRERLQELADFLKTRRARLSPQDVGLPPGSRRRIQGLRREEVAELAGISPTWYAWLEQARPVSVSPSTARKLSNALRLNQSERAYLFDLFEHPELIEYDKESQRVDQKLLSILWETSKPAFLLNHRWDVIAWNSAADVIFQFTKLERTPPNLVHFTFNNRRILEMSPNWAVDAREMLARFRIDYTQHVDDDDELEQLVSVLQRQNQQFRQWWQEHDVINPSGWQRSLEFSEVGTIVMQTELLERSSAPFPRMVIYMPDADSEKRMHRLLTTRKGRQYPN